MPTVYWPSEGDDAKEWPLCDGCYDEVAGEVLIVPGPYDVWGTCSRCGEWRSLNDLQDVRGGGRRDAPSGTCVACAGGLGQRR